MNHFLFKYFDFSKRFQLVWFLIISLTFVLASCSEEDPQHYLEQGRVLVEKGDLESARVQFKNALQLAPKLSDAYFNLALIAEKKQNWGAMHRNLLDTVNTDPAHLEGQIKLGQIYLLSEMYDKAVEQANIILKLSPDNHTANLMLASAELRQGKNKGAIQKIEHVLTQQPYFADAIALKVAYLISQESNNEAFAVLNEGIKHNPDERDLRFLKIRLDIDNKHFDDAAREYEKLHALYPEETGLSLLQVDFLVSIGRLKEAERILREVIDKQSMQVELKLKLVELIEQRGDSKEVEKVLREFILSSPTEPVLKFRLADYYIAQSQFSKAINVLQEIVSSSEMGGDGITAKVKIAQISLQQNNNAKLERLVSEVLSVDANQTDALILRASIRLNKNDADGAIADLRIVLRNRPDSEQVMILMAQANVLKSEWEMAESQWRKVLAINPNNMSAIMPLTSALIKRGDYEQAENLVSNAIKLNPNSLNLIELQIQLKVAQNDWEGARGAISQLNKLPQGRVLSTIWAAHLAMKQREYDKAFHLYKEALNIKPDNPAALSALARASQMAGQNEQLIVYLKSLLLKHPEVDALYYALAVAYATNKDWLDAENLLKEKLQKSGKDSKAYVLLARLYQNQGKQLEVEKTYLAALDVMGENVQLMNELAKFYTLNSEFSKSIKLYEKIIKKYPDNNGVANNLADLLITHQGDNKNSVERAVILVERFQNSSNPIVQDTYGWVHLKSGNVDHALIVLKKAAASMPKDARIHYHLAEAYQQSGDSKAARIELEKSLSFIKEQGQGEFMEIANAKALKKQLDNVNQ